MRETLFHPLAALLLRVWPRDQPPAAGAPPGSWSEMQGQRVEGVAYTLKLEQLPRENLSQQVFDWKEDLG